MTGISSFNDSLQQIDETCAKGNTKEEWLQEKLNAMPADSEQAKGEYLSSANSALTIGNAYVQKILHNPGESFELKNLEENIVGETTEWNKFSLKAMTKNLVQQAVLSGIGGGALSAGSDRIENETGESLAEQLDPSEEPVGSNVDVGFKPAAAGALKVASDKGVIPFLKEETDEIKDYILQDFRDLKNSINDLKNVMKKGRMIELNPIIFDLERLAFRFAESINSFSALTDRIESPIPVANLIIKLSYNITEHRASAENLKVLLPPLAVFV